MRTGIFAALVLAFGVAARAFTYDGAAEITAQGDFDGDGRLDVVIVDKASGQYRVGYQTSANVYTWADPRASGADSVSGVGVGKLFQTTRDSLAIASILANRINLFDVPSPTAAAVPVSVFPPGIGPNEVIAINIPGVGDTAHDDLIVASNGHDGNPGQVALMRNNAGATTLLISTPYPAVTSANRVLLKKGNAEVAGIILRGAPTDEFRVLSPNGTLLNQLIAVTGIASGAQFLYGAFAGGSYTHILFVTAGQSNFTCRAISEPTPGNFAIGTASTFDLGKAIAQMITIPGTTVDRLLVLFQDGSATAYNFNGSATPTVAQTLAPDSGEQYTSAIATPAGDFLLFSGSGGKSQSMRRYSPSGAGFVGGTKTTLPSLTPLTSDANVFVFQLEPFVASQPNLLRSVSAGD